MNNPKISDHKNTYIVSISFLYDDENSDVLYEITVPDSITPADINRILTNTHKKLDNRHATMPERDYYSQEGRDGDTLLWYITKHYGWESKPVEPDVSLTLS